jgi:hypothetical protein
LPSAWDIAAGSASLGVEEIKTHRRSAPTSSAPSSGGASKHAAPASEEDSGAEIVGGSKVTPKTKLVAQTLPEGSTLRMHVSREEAAAKAANLGRLQQAHLTLVPHVTFEYECHLEHELLPQPLNAKGAVLVNAVSGNLRELPALELADPPADADRLQARFSAVDVYEKVKGHILKEVTREVKVEREVGGSTVMGTERIAPSMDELGLNHRGIVQVPVWHLVGEHGSADVDAI